MGETELQGMAELSASNCVKISDACGVVRVLFLLLLCNLVALDAGLVMLVAGILFAVELVIVPGRNGGARTGAKGTVIRGRLGRRNIITVNIAEAEGEKPLLFDYTILHVEIGRMDVTSIIGATFIEGEAALEIEEACMAAIGCKLITGD